MEYIKSHKVLSIVIGAAIVIIVGLIIFFSVVAMNNQVIVEPLTFQEKYAEAEKKVDNLVCSDAEREGFKADLMTYSDKVKQDYDMSTEDKDAFLTLTRKVDKTYLDSKMKVLAFYGKVKEEYDKEVAANIFSDEAKASMDKLFDEYNHLFRDGKYKDAYAKLNEISNGLSTKVNEQGVVQEQQQAPAQDPNAAQAQPNGQQPIDPAAAANVKGRAYHPEASAGQVITDPNNGNTGVVANNGIEVYKLPNESTYSYLTKQEFIEMLVKDGLPEEVAKGWADQMANSQGLITIGVDDDGTYE